MNRVLTSIAIGTLAVGAIALAPTASANEGDYLYDLAQAGYTGNDGTYLGLGYGVCSNLDASQNTLVEAMYQSTGSTIDRAEARYIVESAELYLC